LNILIVDDDQITSKLIEKRLKKRGFSTTTVHCGGDCLNLLREKNHGFDLILLDILMPDITGLEVMKELRETSSQVELPIIMTTSMKETEDIVKALKLGANDYVYKPVNMDILEARMKTHLSIKELNEQSVRQSELETANAMIVTYNHEINNPLTVAMGYLQKYELTGKLDDYDKIYSSLERVAEIVKKIEKVSTESSLDKDDYSQNFKMVKIK